MTDKGRTDRNFTKKKKNRPAAITQERTIIPHISVTKTYQGVYGGSKDRTEGSKGGKGRSQRVIGGKKEDKRKQISTPEEHEDHQNKRTRPRARGVCDEKITRWRCLNFNQTQRIN